MEVSKIESNLLNPHKECFKISELIIGVTNCFKKDPNAKRITFEYSCTDDLIVYADKNDIGRVISNLISNSIKFIQQNNGIISIGSEKKENSNDDDGKNADSKNADSVVVISVSDSGSGIDKGIFPKLFTKFATNSFHGMGLGLYICKSIINAHGGSIWAENNECGKGATFRFSLPTENKLLYILVISCFIPNTNSICMGCCPLLNIKKAITEIMPKVLNLFNVILKTNTFS